MKDILEKIKFNEKGLVPAVLQDIDSKEVLMLAYMNEESLQKTIETGKACFWSRSRQELWLKGETSGNYQEVEEIRFDCDMDTLLVLVKPAGPACHTGKKSCFYRELSDGNIEEISESSQDTLSEKDIAVDEEKLFKASFLFKLYDVIAGRKENPVEGSYTNYLFEKGVDKICKKVGEESAEVIIGAKNGSQEEMVYEIGDLIYHLMVLMNLYEIPLTDILDELESRSK
ncbi:MAG: bifunctional phosphoribosyl-AMP cyclohydrolase/phosphoribosyl-ATP diphosphatase HisIE [Halanaerobiaceae bacterium]